MPLRENEEVRETLEGNSYNVSSNAIARLLSVIERLVSVILGCPKKTYMYVTDTRVITIEVQTLFWVIEGSISARSYTPRSITRIGYSLQRSLIVFKSHYLEFESGSGGLLIMSKEGREKVYQMIDQLTALPDRVRSI
jgi:hypothetical protein